MDCHGRFQKLDNSAAIGSLFQKVKSKRFKSKFHLDINGKTVQQGNTEEMIYSVDKIISYISSFFTVKIGDLILQALLPGIGPVAIDDHLQGYIEDRNCWILSKITYQKYTLYRNIMCKNVVKLLACILVLLPAKLKSQEPDLTLFLRLCHHCKLRPTQEGGMGDVGAATMPDVSQHWNAAKYPLSQLRQDWRFLIHHG